MRKLTTSGSVWGCWYDLEQLEVARGVEEVGAGKVLFEIVAAPFGHEVYGYAGGVGGNERAGFSVLLYLLVNFLFDVEVFDHHLNDPVHVFDAGTCRHRSCRGIRG